MYLYAAILKLLTSTASALIGFDCSGPTLNISTFSTVDPIQCDSSTIKPTVTTKQIQLLQLSDFRNTHVTQCHIEINRTVYHCGMYSHISAVNNGRQIYLLNILRDVCQMILHSGTFYITPTAQITGILPNSTSTRSLTLAGSLENDGTCHGSTFSDPYGTWSDAVVQTVARVKIMDYTAPIKLTSNEIILKSGQTCPVQQGSCPDTMDGYSFWDNSPSDNCNFQHYDVLYDGKASIMCPEEEPGPCLYSVISQETTFALAKTTTTKICGYNLIHTEHPKLFILETTTGDHFKTRGPISINNLDIFTYVNSKFIYVEKHIKTQITQLYNDVVKQRCTLEKQILNNALTLIHFAPAEVARMLTKEEGHMAIPTGEVIHVIKCIPVVCQVRSTDSCYDELPVTYKNSSMFLTPVHRILVKSGTRRECSELLPAMYKIHGAWYKMIPKPIESLPPATLKPLAQATWKYINPHNLAEGGIYSPADVQKLKERIMFPIEQPAIVNFLAQVATANNIIHNQ
ncbi:hypothetical protein WH47_00966 [Habropoda laboriosa]|uniref:Uncharacterized protein n=1 Tax=Habropoda laboriosa TaxID=597456 RepID=A0A0L7QK30_9HYME|nr:hypothetical protein WH47_00966 [Habropoda laboriosa]